MIVLGSLLGPLRLLDVSRDEMVSSHNVCRSCCHCVSCHGSVILSSHRNGVVSVYDLREPVVIQSLQAHAMPCCTALFDFDGVRFATGSDDCSCTIWDVRNISRPSCMLCGHSAAVRGISWCPRAHNRIATGGGTQDRRIRIWDTDTGDVIVETNTGSQICNVFWMREYNEILTTEGFQNCTMTFWSETDLKAVGAIREHQDRVLYCAMSPIHNSAVTLTRKDGLRIWGLGKGEEAAPPKAPIR
jgi:WD40 repeat protein